MSRRSRSRRQRRIASREAHDTPLSAWGASMLAIVQAEYPPVGLIEMKALPPASTATHSDVAVHETPVRALPVAT